MLLQAETAVHQPHERGRIFKAFVPTTGVVRPYVPLGLLRGPAITSAERGRGPQCGRPQQRPNPFGGGQHDDVLSAECYYYSTAAGLESVRLCEHKGGPRMHRRAPPPASLNCARSC